MKNSLSTSDLVKRLKRGDDEAAVTQMVERFGGRLLSAALLMCDNYADAQDLAMETLQRGVRNIATFREGSSLFSWLYGILFNLNRMAWRKRSRSRVIYTDELPEVAEVEVAPGSGIDQESLAHMLAAAVRRLSPILQETVILRYYCEMSIAEVAATLS